jgi:hypothetical protein
VKRLLLAIAIAVASVIGCTPDSPKAALVAVAAPLWVAPLAEDHEWVIALWKEASVRGLPDRDDKHALAGFLREYEQVRPRPPELVPVWAAHLDGPGGAPRWQLHFIDKHAGFQLDGGASATLIHRDGAPLVLLQFSPAQAEQFAALTRVQVGRRVALTIDDEVLDVISILPPLEAAPTDGVTLRGHSSRNPEVAAQTLLERLQQAN